MVALNAKKTINETQETNVTLLRAVENKKLLIKEVSFILPTHLIAESDDLKPNGFKYKINRKHVFENDYDIKISSTEKTVRLELMQVNGNKISVNSESAYTFEVVDEGLVRLKSEKPFKIFLHWSNTTRSAEDSVMKVVNCLDLYLRPKDNLNYKVIN